MAMCSRAYAPAWQKPQPMPSTSFQPVRHTQNGSPSRQHARVAPSSPAGAMATSAAWPASPPASPYPSVSFRPADYAELGLSAAHGLCPSWGEDPNMGILGCPRGVRIWKPMSTVASVLRTLIHLTIDGEMIDRNRRRHARHCYRRTGIAVLQGAACYGRWPIRRRGYGNRWRTPFLLMGLCRGRAGSAFLRKARQSPGLATNNGFEAGTGALHLERRVLRLAQRSRTGYEADR